LEQEPDLLEKVIIKDPAVLFMVPPLITRSLADINKLSNGVELPRGTAKDNLSK